MKLEYLIILGLFISLASCKKRPDCAPGSLSSCHTEIMESSTDYDICDCVCVSYNKDRSGYVYRSPIDDRGFCWWELGPGKSNDYEFYAFDHHHIRTDGFLERVFGKIEIYYDGDKLVNSGFFPYEGRVHYDLRFPYLDHKCNPPDNYSNLEPFYMKDNNRDTLFMDQLVGFGSPTAGPWNANSHVICGDIFFSRSFMVRREDGMDWYKRLYRYSMRPIRPDSLSAFRFDAQYDYIEPDTTYFIHMPRLFPKG
jgi:hypothetical protein